MRSIAPLILLLLAGLPALAGEVRPLPYETGFETDPFAAGWAWGKPSWAKKARAEGKAYWNDRAAEGEHALTVSSGMWRGPKLAAEPGTFCKLSFLSRTARRGYWAVLCYDEAGKELPPSPYSGLMASEDWQRTTAAILIPPRTAYAKLLIWPVHGDIHVDSLSFRAISRDEATAIAERTYAELPPLELSVGTEHWQHLPQTRRRLAAGKPVRIVLLGDSVANDVAHSNFQLLVERAWPGSKVVLVNQVGSGANAARFLEGDVLQKQCLAFKPDLVLFGGMSNRPKDVPDIAKLAAEVQAAGAEFAAFTDTMLTPRYWNKERFERNRAAQRKYRQALAEAGREAAFAVLDIGTPWEDYILRIDRDIEAFRRDGHHANEAGKQIYGRLLAAFLMPPEPE